MKRINYNSPSNIKVRFIAVRFSHLVPGIVKIVRAGSYNVEIESRANQLSVHPTTTIAQNRKSNPVFAGLIVCGVGQVNEEVPILVCFWPVQQQVVRVG